MVKREELQVLQGNMKTKDTNQEEICKPLEAEQAVKINTKEVYHRIKEEVRRRINIIEMTELSNKN